MQKSNVYGPDMGLSALCSDAHSPTTRTLLILPCGCDCLVSGTARCPATASRSRLCASQEQRQKSRHVGLGKRPPCPPRPIQFSHCLAYLAEFRNIKRRAKIGKLADMPKGGRPAIPCAGEHPKYLTKARPKPKSRRLGSVVSILWRSSCPRVYPHPSTMEKWQPYVACSR